MKKALPLLLLIGCVNSKPSSQEAGTTSAPVVSATASASAAPPSTAFSVTQCESLLVDGERTLAGVRAKAATDCKKDDDCQIIETSACIPVCADRAIAKKAVPGYNREREQIRMGQCKLWNDAECPRTTPKATPECTPMKAACKANKCEAVLGT
jgi:hypothetical protein